MNGCSDEISNNILKINCELYDEFELINAFLIILYKIICLGMLRWETAFLMAVPISGEFEESIWKAKYSDNELCWSVAVSFTLLFTQFSVQTNPLSENWYQSILKQWKMGAFDQKDHKSSIYVKIFWRFKQLDKIAKINLHDLKIPNCQIFLINTFRL